MKVIYLVIAIFFMSCSKDKSDSIEVVKENTIFVQSLTISGADISTGLTGQMSATVLPIDANKKEVVWSTSDGTIATISSTGLLTALKNGQVTVTATSTDGSEKKAEKQISISGIITVYATTPRAESILAWQRNNGGWGKAVPNLNDYNNVQTATQLASALASKNNLDTTIDNGHVTTELRWLVADYKTTNNPIYLAAAEKAIDFLFLAQYANGGWPQYFPDKSLYRHQITYNDGAMANVMNLMWDIQKGKNNLELVNPVYKAKAIDSFNRGIDIMLKTQITYKGKKTVWCAQHDEISLQPALARAYELPSFSGSESVGIVRVLMLVENPSTAVQQAIKDAIDWFDTFKIVGITTQKITDLTQTSGLDVIVVSAPGTVSWARFYDLNNSVPMFCGRDGIPKLTLAEIENERRVGYSWYGNWASNLIGSEYTSWKSKNGL